MTTRTTTDGREYPATRKPADPVAVRAAAIEAEEARYTEEKDTRTETVKGAG